jgi:hypothetical protein
MDVAEEREEAEPYAAVLVRRNALRRAARSPRSDTHRAMNESTWQEKADALLPDDEELRLMLALIGFRAVLRGDTKATQPMWSLLKRRHLKPKAPASRV